MTPREEKLSHAELTRLLAYDPETGVFRWKEVTSNRVKVGDVAGQSDTNGHIIIQVNGLRYMAHRLAWFYVHQQWPSEEIDHKNRVKNDNRINNLREANRNENNRNVSKKKHNTTGFKGVTRHTKSKHKFVAQITVDGRCKYLGIFDTPEDAHAEYVRASMKYHKSFGVII